METRNILRGQIYWCDFGIEKIQGVQSGIRPAIILSNNVGNKFSPTIIVSAITSRIEKSNKVPTHLRINNCGLKTESVVLLEQVYTINKNKLGNYIGCIDEVNLKRINKIIDISMKEIKNIDKIANNLREEIERQLKDIYAYEDVIRTTKNNIIVNELLKERESLLIELDKYCSDNGYEYKMFYEDYKTRIC